MNIGKSITNNLFGHPEKLTNAHLVYFKVLEFFVAWKTIEYAWYWGLYTLKINDVVLPLGFANIVDISFMHNGYTPLINASLITIVVILSFFRIGFKWQYLLVMFLLHVQYVARFSIGEIPHSANLPGMALFSFAMGTLFFSTKESKYRFIIGITVFYIGFGYFSASMSKLIGTGINWVDGRHLWLWIAEKGTDILSREGEFQYTIVQEIALKSIPAATAMLVVGILSEFFGIFMWFRKARPFVTIALVGMHFGVTMSMNIRFDDFMMLLILIGFPWPEWYNTYNYKIRSLLSPDKLAI
ncbi:MAG: hypothetical protein Pars93KO_26380 [Parasphingorhabdus sp.]